MTDPRSRWDHTCALAGLSPQTGESGWQRLDRLHREPPRAYHNLNHVADCLAQLDRAPVPDAGRLELEFAIWWHDAVYDSTRSDNEENSAAEWRQFSNTTVLEKSFVQAVTDLIGATTHREPAADPLARWMQDIDLSILGRNRATFDEYEKAIRQEYAWVDDAAFVAGRSAFLEALLSRPQIYLTPHFRALFEQTARENLQHSINTNRSP